MNRKSIWSVLFILSVLSFAAIVPDLMARSRRATNPRFDPGATRKTANLSDLTNAATARQNLSAVPIASITTPGAMVIQGASQVASAGATAENQLGSTTFQAFVGLGGPSAPRIKMKKLTGTTPTAAASNTPILPAGVDAAKVIGVSILVEYSAGNWMKQGFNSDPAYGFGVVFYGASSYFVSTGASATADVLGKSYKILVMYEE